MHFFFRLENKFFLVDLLVNQYSGDSVSIHIRCVLNCKIKTNFFSTEKIALQLFIQIL